MSPDRTRLAVFRQLWTLTFCDITDGTEKVLFDIHDSSIHLPTFSPDGSNFASVIGNTVIHVWDSSTVTVITESQQHVGKIISFVFSPDGTRIISICKKLSWYDEETIVHIWHIIEGPDIMALDCGHDVRSVAPLPNSVQFITISYGDTVKIWNITHTPVLLSILSTSGHHDTLVISPDGTRLLSFSPLRSTPYQLFDLPNQKELVPYFNLAGDTIGAAVFSPDSSRIACDTGTYLAIIDATDGVLLHHPIQLDRRHVWKSLAFSPDSTRLLHMSPEGDIRIFNIEHLPTSVDIKISYPPDHIVTRKNPYMPTGYHLGDNGDTSVGWYCGENGAHLIWLPKDMRHVWLVMHRSLVLEQTAREVTVLDMTDYLNAVPTARVAWRNGGIRYTSSDAEVAGAYASVGKW
jgi:WD40 repeat protein